LVCEGPNERKRYNASLQFGNMINHDTSTVMIERNYSRHIGDHSDQLARRALLETGAPTATSDKVVPINAGR